MEPKELLIALLYLGFHLQTKASENEDQGAFIAGYRDTQLERETHMRVPIVYKPF
jgi:hypothetical protein